jgi:hypothetical protein
MGKLCLSMHLITLCTPCVALVSMAHTCIFVIDYAEHGLKEPPKLAPVDIADYE